MQKLLLIVLVSASCLCKAQLHQVTFDKLLHDFGYIKESEGKVFCSFELFNKGKIPVEVTEIATSCGCAIPFAEKKKVAPGESCLVKITYDPQGRPGKFMKSVEVKIKADTAEQVFFVNIKGTVIGKEILKEYSETNDKLNRLHIKPFSSVVISSSDMRFLSQPAIRDFINDLTYEIDLYNFTTIKLELFSGLLDENNPVDEDLFPVIKKFIISEMEKRNYTKNQLSFSDNYVYDRQLPAETKSQLKISSLYLNNDTIKESGFYRTKAAKENYREPETDTLYFRSSVAGVYRQNGKKLKKNNDYEEFIESCTRAALVNKKVILGVTFKGKMNALPGEDENSAFIAAAGKLQEQLAESLEEKGISAAKIEFIVPSLSFTIDSTARKNDPEFYILQFHPSAGNNRDIDSSVFFAHNRKSVFAENHNGFRAPYQNLPVYFQYYTPQKNKPDTASSSWKAWLDVIGKEMTEGKEIRFMIESGCSDNPLYRKYEKTYMSRLREGEIKQWLVNALGKRGLAEEKIIFEDPVYLQQSLKYNTGEYNIEFYSKYDYIKIIPLYPSDSSKARSHDPVIPYIVNFNYNHYELPVQSEVFQSFLSRLIPLLDVHGTLRLVVETSTTKVPVKGVNDLDHYAKQRTEKTKNLLLNEIKKAGYDPLRVIITEQRSLMQGPFYRPGYETARAYEKYQYIKIFPEDFLKE